MLMICLFFAISGFGLYYLAIPAKPTEDFEIHENNSMQRGQVTCLTPRQHLP